MLLILFHLSFSKWSDINKVCIRFSLNYHKMLIPKSRENFETFFYILRNQNCVNKSWLELQKNYGVFTFPFTHFHNNCIGTCNCNPCRYNHNSWVKKKLRQKKTQKIMCLYYIFHHVGRIFFFPFPIIIIIYL